MNDLTNRLTALEAGKEPRRLNRSYSVFVRRLRLIFPMLVIAIIAALFTWITFDEEDTVIELPQEVALRRSAPQNELLKPNFQSTDEKGRPYKVTAKRALQDSEDEKLVRLEEPEGYIRLEDQVSLNLRAQQGRYHQDKKNLQLSGKVELRYDEVYTIQSEAANLNLQESKAWSSENVQGKGPAGSVSATGFEANITDETLIFTGPAKLTLYLEDL